MRPLIAGNWKMNRLAPQRVEIEAIAVSVQASPPLADILLCLPATLIERAARRAAGRIAIGGENFHAEIAGEFTGDVSAEMLNDAGGAAVIVGHSERRQQHGENDAIVAAKAKAAKRAGLLAITCIGETKSQRMAGKAFSVCGDQVAGSVPEGMASSAVTVGYEPFWAIGTVRRRPRRKSPKCMPTSAGALRRAWGRKGEEGANPVRRVDQTCKRARGIGAAGNWRRAGGWRKPEGAGFRGDFQGRSGNGVSRAGRSATMTLSQP